MFRHVPNLLTGARLVLAIVFFVMLSFYQYEGRGAPLLNVAFIIYTIALFTDFLDGYLARLWKVEGAFGRIVDPFVDKILVLGSFAFFAGKNFIIPESDDQIGPFMVVKTITGVTPAMVIVLLGRELLVTTLRGMAESSGQSFGAEWSGKVKMVIQSFTILAILVFVKYRGALLRHHWETPVRWMRDIFIWATVAVTVLSGLAYVQKAVVLYRRNLVKE